VHGVNNIKYLGRLSSEKGTKKVPKRHAKPEDVREQVCSGD